MTFEEKLSESGISKDTAKKYGITEVASILKDISAGPDAAAIKIPYYDINGNKLDFQRYRILKSNKGIFHKIGFKYFQVKGSNVEVYLPRTIKWKDVAKINSEDIIITEGEFKSIALAEAGYNGIGLGGVSSYQSKKQHQALIKPLNEFVWKDRNVCIIYDSDLNTNVNVRSSQFKLARILSDLGAIVSVAFVQSTDGAKYGIDDAIVKYGPSIVETLLNNAQAFTSYDVIEQLSEEAAYCINQEKIYYFKSNVFTTVQGFHDNMANRFINVYKMDKDGETKVCREKLSKEWLQSPLRCTIQDTIFEPNNEERFIVDNVSGKLYYNTFDGYQIKPLENVKGLDKKPAVKMFMQLLNFLCRDLEPENFKWFLHWIAEGLRNPGTKMRTAVIVWSNMEGNGKSTIGLLLSRLYGKYSTTVTSSMLQSQYNQFLQEKLFIMSDELTGEDVENVKEVKQYMDQLKNLITQDEVVINAKYMRPKTIKDYARYYFTSNNINMIAINELSRRFFIIHAAEDCLPQEFYTQFYKTVMTDEGLQQIMTFLLNYEVDEEIALNSNAPTTAAKLEIVENSRTIKHQWFIDMCNAASNVEPFEASGFASGQIVPEIITLKELTEAAGYALGKNQHLSNLKRSLKKYNIKMMDKKIRTNKHSSGDTIVILANEAKWLKAEDDKIIKYINNWRSYVFEPDK